MWVKAVAFMLQSRQRQGRQPAVDDLLIQEHQSRWSEERKLIVLGTSLGKLPSPLI